MIRQANTPRPMQPAAAYIRMSGRQQDKSPAEQRAEITKLAAREGCRVVEWQSDEAITGNSTTDDRPGLAALLAGAKAGRFTVVLAWHTNRITREDPMDAIVFYNQLRKAGVNLHTCCEGAIDLDNFTSQLLLFVNQKGSNDYLTELAAKSLRGRIATAKAGDWTAGEAPYGMDRGEFDPSGNLVRRLARGDKRSKGNRLRLLPSDDSQKVEAVQYAFQRAGAAHMSYQQIAQELQAKGYPAPGGKGWTKGHVERLLKNPAYAGTNRWGVTGSGSYYSVQGEEVTVPNAATHKWRRKIVEDMIIVAGAHEGIISPDLFNRVNRNVQPGKKRRRTVNDRYPLSGLLVCAHCDKSMVANEGKVKDKKGKVVRTHQTYVCSSYIYYRRTGILNTTNCGFQSVRPTAFWGGWSKSSRKRI